jgi:hypothetical protein
MLVPQAIIFLIGTKKIIADNAYMNLNINCKNPKPIENLFYKPRFVSLSRKLASPLPIYAQDIASCFALTSYLLL